MHRKKNYNNKSYYSIQGLRPVSRSLPGGFKSILKKGGHNYSTIVKNWATLVGKEIANACYPKSVKTNRQLENGILSVNVNHGDQILVEYNKQNIIDKINSFFGYKFINDIRLFLIKEKINIRKIENLSKKNNLSFRKKIKDIKNKEFKNRLGNLIDVFNGE